MCSERYDIIHATVETNSDVCFERIMGGVFCVYFQTPVTAAGSWFALSQSAGVLGMAATTKAAVGAVAGGITYVASLFV